MTDLFDPSIYELRDDDLAGEYNVCNILEVAGGSLSGRVRLQKTVFLLGKLRGTPYFPYAYHHYGPYSAELAEAVDVATIFGMVSESVEHRDSDGARYSRYELVSKPRIGVDGFLKTPSAVSALSAIEKAGSTVLELAATAYWLKYDEGQADWRTEIVRRKGVKTEGGRLEKAIELLREIGLGRDMAPA